VIFEPFYENYGPDAIVSGARPRYVRMAWPDWTVDEEALKAAFTDRTKVLILNTPNNPTGKVFTREELQIISGLCQRFGVVAFTDEIYEHITYDGAAHIPLITDPGMEDRTVLVNALSKTYSVTGWRVGWTISSPTLTDGIRKVHDFLTVGAAHPLQVAVAQALELPASFYVELLGDYQERRDAIVGGLNECGFEASSPDGAYYVMAGIRSFGTKDDVAFARRLIEEVAVATVPASSFYHDPGLGRGYVRFSFPKKVETIERGLAALRALGRS